MNKKQLIQMLADVKSGKVKLETVQASLESTRGMQKTLICNIKDISAITLKENSAYFVEGGNLFSLPLKKTRNDGRVAEFVPYYRTVSAMETLSKK